MRKALQGLMVLDLTSFLAGPFSSQLLAGLGAEVIKIERPDTGDGARANPPYFGPKGINFGEPIDGDLSLSILKRNRNKKSLTLDLRSEKGREIFKQLAEDADIVIENFRPGVVRSLGVHYEALREINPDLIYCSISGFGQYGLHGDRPAFDVIVQAMSGLMDVTGFSERLPIRTGVSIADLSASLYATIGVLAAVYHRDRTHQGQKIDIAMLDCLFSLVFDEAYDLYESLDIPVRTGNRRPRATPFGVYEALDGHLAICAPVEEHCHALFEEMGREDLIKDPEFSSLEARFENASKVDATIEEWTKTKSKNELCNQLAARGIPCGPVQSVQEVISDPQLKARDMIVDLEHSIYGVVDEAVGTGMPIKFSPSLGAYDAPAPLLGEHTDEILTKYLGYSKGEISKLVREGTI